MADNTNRLAGIATISADGQSFMLSGDLSYGVSTFSRETMIGQDRVHGYSEKPHAGFISATIRDSGGLTVADINAMTNTTVVCELANGKTIIGRNMWTIDAQEVKTMDATFDVKWESFLVEEA